MSNEEIGEKVVWSLKYVKLVFEMEDCKEWLKDEKKWKMKGYEK